MSFHFSLKFRRETENYSGSDLTALAKDAAMGPVREVRLEQLKDLTLSRIRPLTRVDFQQALKKIRASVPKETLKNYLRWNEAYGESTDDERRDRM